MKRFILGAALMGALVFYQPSFGCHHDAKKVMKHYLAYRHLGVLSTAIDIKGNVFMWFINSQTKEWSLIRITDDNRACFLTEGTDYRFALEAFL